MGYVLENQDKVGFRRAGNGSRPDRRASPALGFPSFCLFFFFLKLCAASGHVRSRGRRGKVLIKDATLGRSRGSGEPREGDRAVGSRLRLPAGPCPRGHPGLSTRGFRNGRISPPGFSPWWLFALGRLRGRPVVAGVPARGADRGVEEKARRPPAPSRTWRESWRARCGGSPRCPRPPGSHPSPAFTPWSLFPAVRIMNLHELIM